VLKKGLLLISILYTVVLTTLCLVRLDNMPNVGVTFSDKIFHLLAYVVLTFLWINTILYKFELKKQSAILYGAIFCIIFGIVIEVLQGSLTSYRSSDFYDVVANTCGVLLTVLFLSIKKLAVIKK
jgi:VanZ family protein